MELDKHESRPDIRVTPDRCDLPRIAGRGFDPIALFGAGECGVALAVDGQLKANTLDLRMGDP